MHVAPHPSNEQLAEYSLIATKHQPAVLDQIGGHVRSCGPCAERVAELARVVSLFRSLPDEAPPRDFRLGPRLLGQLPPRAHRLLRLYTWTRAAAASAAAISILLIGADLALPPGAATSVVQSPPSALNTPASRPAESARSAPAPAGQPAPPGAQTPGSAPAPAAQVARPAAGSMGPAAAPAGSARNKSAEAGGTGPAPAGSAPSSSAGADGPASSSEPAAPADVGDQRAAATGVQPLPAPPADAVAGLPVASDRGLYRLLAVLAALLALAATVAAVVVRSRLTRTIIPPHSTPGGHPS